MNQRRKPDHFTKRAKRSGFAARSAFKLEEIDHKVSLFRTGARVLDLGCSPGSWMQYAAKRVGAKGFVLGFDLKSTTGSLPGWAEARVGDAFELTDDDLGEGGFDVVLSDMAPATTGHRVTDATRSIGLAERALDVAESRLREGGAFVVKVLEGGDVPAFVQRMRGGFAKVQRLRPDATRKQSTEIFIIGTGRRRDDAGEEA